MRKIVAVAAAEYRQVVFTISFLLSLLLPLLLYGGMFAFGYFFGDKTDLRDRRIAVVDRTGELFDGLQQANIRRDRSEAVMRNGRQIGPRFVLEQVTVDSASSDRELQISLSERVRTGELFAFAIIGEDYLSVDGGDRNYLRYYSDSPTFNRLPDWLSSTVQDLVEERRFAEAGVNRREINRLISHREMERFRLVEVDAQGNIIDPKQDNKAAAMLIPFGLLMLIFISIQMTTPILLNSVIEEKMQRIAEVLLASVTPWQLLSGKLLAGVGVGLTFSATYLFSAILTLRYFEKSDWIPAGTLLWFFLFLLLGMLVFGSMLAGLSSACQDLKDSQNFAGTVILILLVPFMVSLVTVESPDGPLAVALSLIPPFSVMGMMVRVAIPPGPPDWQIWLALLLNVTFAAGVVWAASRIFRIGILSQGKTPTWGEILRWIFQRG